MTWPKILGDNEVGRLKILYGATPGKGDVAFSLQNGIGPEWAFAATAVEIYERRVRGQRDEVR